MTKLLQDLANAIYTSAMRSRYLRIILRNRTCIISVYMHAYAHDILFLLMHVNVLSAYGYIVDIIILYYTICR